MKAIISFIAITCVFGLAVADTSVWHGKVSSDGSPSPSVKLTLGQNYKVKVSGKMNLGKWRTGGQALENDACFEFFANPERQDHPPTKTAALRASIHIDVCGGKYQSNHTYESNPFIAAQNGIHFWIQDVDYEDNSGELDVEIVHVKDE